MKRFQALIGELERCILSQKVGEGPSDLRKVFNEPPVEPRMTLEAMDPFYVHRRWELLYDLDFSFVHLDPSLGHKMPKYDAFTDHEMAFFPIQYEVLLLASLQDFI